MAKKHREVDRSMALFDTIYRWILRISCIVCIPIVGMATITAEARFKEVNSLMRTRLIIRCLFWSDTWLLYPLALVHMVMCGVFWVGTLTWIIIRIEKYSGMSRIDETTIKLYMWIKLVVFVVFFSYIVYVYGGEQYEVIDMIDSIVTTIVYNPQQFGPTRRALESQFKCNNYETCTKKAKIWMDDDFKKMRWIYFLVLFLLFIDVVLAVFFSNFTYFYKLEKEKWILEEERLARERDIEREETYDDNTIKIELIENPPKNK